MPAVGSVLTVSPGHYNNEFNYALTGTVTAFTNTTITLIGGSATNNAYVGYAVCFTNLTNPGTNRLVTAYDGATKIATLDGLNWTSDGGSAPVVGTTIWGICNDFPVDRRFQWIKDGAEIPGAIGGTYTPHAAGSYQVKETAFFPSTSGLTTVTTSAAVVITGTRDAGLVYSDNLVWQGCFYPPNLYPSSDFVFGGVIAYNPAGNSGAGSLFCTGNISPPLAGEFTIPTPSQVLGSVPTATMLNTSGLVDQFEGQRTVSGIAGGGGIVASGMLVDGGKLIMTATENYATMTSASWFWRRPLNLATTGAVEGPFAITDVSFRDNPRCYAGYMANVPASLQTKLGGPIVAGLAAQSIVSNTSDGPTLASFDAANMTSLSAKRGTFVAATANTMTLSSGASMSSTTNFYVDYWLTSADGASSARKVTAYNGATKIATVDSNWATTPSSSDWVLIPPVSAKALAMYGIDQFQSGTSYPYIWDWKSSPLAGCAVINGTRSALIFGVGGNNYYMYAAPPQVRNGVMCYDPSDNSSGEHNYPYYIRCWAYDANELEQVRLGNVLPNNAKPYAVWNIDNQPILGGVFSGVAYDAANKRLFLASNSGGFGRTVIHVYSVTNASYP